MKIIDTRKNRIKKIQFRDRENTSKFDPNIFDRYGFRVYADERLGKCFQKSFSQSKRRFPLKE